MVVIDLIILVVYAAVEGSRGNLGAIRLVNQENPVDIEEEVIVLCKCTTFKLFNIRNVRLIGVLNTLPSFTAGSRYDIQLFFLHL